MQKRSAPVLLPAGLVLLLLGVWTGTSLGQVPPLPTVSVPTVSVSLPTEPIPTTPPVAPPPSVSTPAVPAPAPPKLPVDLPTERVPVTVPAAVPRTPATGPALGPAADSPSSGSPATATRHFGASSRFFRLSRAVTSRAWLAARSDRALAGNPTRRAAGVSATGRPDEDDSASSLGAAAGTIAAAAEDVPPVLIALAVLAVMLLAVAAMPRPVGSSRAAAAFVHHRGTLATAGIGVLIAAVLSLAFD